MKKILFTTMIFSLLSNGASAQTILTDGAELEVKDSHLKVEFIKDDIVRVRWTKEKTFADADNNICIDRPKSKIKMKHADKDGVLTLTSDSMSVSVNKSTGSIIYRDRKGKTILAENSATPHEGEKIYVENVTFDESTRHTVKTADGDKEVMDVLRRDTVGSTWKWTLNLQFKPEEALYGLGGYMEDYMNLRGKRVYLCQHNLKEMVPVLNSTAGYGILINAGSEMIFSDTDGKSSIEIGAAPGLDYYFMKGWNMDATVKNYRWLTGEVPMMPLYLFGYTQSKERYVSSADLISTLKRFRDNHIPIDMIVQDWNYWEPGSWGHMKMNTRDYPDKRALTDAIHDMNAKLMISIWPSMTNSPQEKDFAKRGMLLPGTNVYDVFSPAARDLYWKYANDEFFSNGFDAWWCDSSEPIDADWGNRGQAYTWDSHAERFNLCSKRLGDALGHERSQLYSLYHSMGIYNHQRQVTDKKRVVNLTRSSYAGQQRYSTIVWNGDTHASWEAFAQMIPAGLNFVSTGCPYWTVDAGAFFVKKGWAWFYDGDYEKGCDDLGYRELYTRMLQYATFLPVMRSHGTDTPREPWRFGDANSPFYKSIIDCIKLRYSLLPYTYSLAADVSFNGGTMMRPLAFDYAADPKVADIKDQFMLGKSLLVAPVTTQMYYGPGSTPVEGTKKQRTVYLPGKGTWYDFFSGANYKGEQSITVDAPIDRIPVFVPAGSIIPMCKGDIEYSAQYTDVPWEIRVYPGKDGSFCAYQDAGDGYAYEKGEKCSFKFLWNDKKRTLTISAREGQYAPDKALKLIVTTPDGAEATVVYDGEKKVIKL